MKPCPRNKANFEIKTKVSKWRYSIDTIRILVGKDKRTKSAEMNQNRTKTYVMAMKRIRPRDFLPDAASKLNPETRAIRVTP